MARKVKAARSVTACTTVLALAVFGTPAIAGAQTGATCNGLPATIEVTNPLNTVFGTKGDDVIVVVRNSDGMSSFPIIDTGEGDDSICIRADGVSPDLYDILGDVTIDAGPGDDYVLGSPGPEFVDAGDGRDFIRAGAGDDWLSGGAGQDEIWAQAGDDFVFGEDGHDFLHAGPGNDEVDAGRGDDVVFGGKGEDFMLGGLGYDVMRGGKDSDTIYANGLEFPGPGSVADVPDTDGNELYGGGAADFLVGSSGDDVLRGGNGQDGVFGQEGDDFIRGGNGEDVIAGGLGNDDVRGGGHSDVIFIEGPDVTSGSSGPDACYLVDDNDPGPISSCEEILDF